MVLLLINALLNLNAVGRSFRTVATVSHVKMPHYIILAARRNTKNLTKELCRNRHILKVPLSGER